MVGLADWSPELIKLDHVKRSTGKTTKLRSIWYREQDLQIYTRRRNTESTIVEVALQKVIPMGLVCVLSDLFSLS